MFACKIYLYEERDESESRLQSAAGSVSVVQQQMILSLEFQSNSSDGESNIESARAETASKTQSKR